MARVHPMALVVLAGCATGMPVGGRGLSLRYEPFGGVALPRADPVVEAPVAPAPVVDARARQAAVAIARSLLGKRHVRVAGASYGSDCTSLVRAAYHPLDVMGAARKGDSGVEAIFRFAALHGVIDERRGEPGDLVFFRETYDRNGDGHVNDGLTHIGVVERVDSDGTVTMLHVGSRGVARSQLNLSAPGRPTDGAGKRINSWLRVAGKGSPPRLTAELFAGFGRLERSGGPPASAAR